MEKNKIINLSDDFKNNQEVFERLLVDLLERQDIQEAKNAIAKVHIADLAGFFNRATYEQKEKVLSILDDSQISNLIIELDETVIQTVIEMLDSKKTAKIIESLDIDDAIYVLDSLEEDLEYDILKSLKSKKQKELNEGLSYPEGSAGRLMQKNFISVPENWTVKQALDFIQAKTDPSDISEVFYEIYVVNFKNNPLGIVPVSLLIAKSANATLRDIMNEDFKSVKTDLPEEEVSYLFKKYSLVTVPVVTKHGRLVGVVTLADAMEVIDKQAEENIMHMGGVREDDVHLNLFEVIKSRFPWLLLSLITATLCSLVVNLFHDTIAQAVILSAIMPIVSGISGNAGTQTMTVTVLSLSSKELTALNITRVIMKQIISCSFNGLVLAIFGGIFLVVLHNNVALSFIFGMAVLINFALAGFLGSVIPILINKIGFDPAVASPVFVTTLIDILSFAIFLSLAAKLLI
jgi:magnesium transporter